MKLTILGCEGEYVSPCLLLESGDGSNHGQGYRPWGVGPSLLINCPEGIVRTLLEHHVKLHGPGLHGLLTTRIAPSSTGGIPSLFLHLSSCGHDVLHVWGAQGLAPWLARHSPFVHWRHPVVVTFTHSDPGVVIQQKIKPKLTSNSSFKNLIVTSIFVSGGATSSEQPEKHGCALCVRAPSASPQECKESEPQSKHDNDECEERRHAKYVKLDHLFSRSPSSTTRESVEAILARQSAPQPCPTIGTDVTEEPLPDPGLNGWNCMRAPTYSVDAIRRPENPRANPLYRHVPSKAAQLIHSSPQEPLNFDGGVIYFVEEDDTPDQVVAFVDASISLISVIVNHPVWKHFESSTKTCAHSLTMVVHLGPCDIVTHDGYRDWIRSLGSHCQHIFPSIDTQGDTSLQATRARTMRCHKINPAMFPLVPEPKSLAALPDWLTAMPNRVVVHFLGSWFSETRRPSHSELESFSVPALDDSPGLSKLLSSYRNVIKRSLRSHANRVAARQLKQSLDCDIPRPSFQQDGDEAQFKLLQIADRIATENADFPSPCISVTMLGTGSARSSKYRGASAILVQPEDSSSILLLDCGEGTYRAMMNILTEPAAIGRLACIWISHFHADHTLGLPRVILERAKVPGSCPLVVVGPAIVGDWLAGVLPSHRLLYNFEPCLAASSSPRVLSHLAQHLHITSLVSVPVHHCYDSYGLVLTHLSGFKLVYSGDTRPCTALIAAGRRCHLLIHEATFSNLLQDHAIAKKHSTIAEAMDMAIQMDASRVVLTHFSQRYPKMADIPSTLSHRVIVAFDHMTIVANELGWAPLTVPLLQLAFQTNIPSLAREEKGEPAWSGSDDSADEGLKAGDAGSCAAEGRSVHIKWASSDDEHQ